MPLYARSVANTARMLVSPRAFVALNRVATLLVAYLSTALGIVATIYVMRRYTDAQTLTATMATLFLIQLTAGLEPATVRGLLLRKIAPFDIHIPAVVRATLVKATITSPVIFGIWLFTWPNVPSLAFLALLSPIMTAIGFITSDTRSLYEARGHYTYGMWAKQGSVMLGMFLIAAISLAGGSVLLAIALSLLGRALFVIPFLVNLARETTTRDPLNDSDDNGLAGILRHKEWRPLAGTSILSALSGSLDRLVVLRFLSPEKSATYIVLFEFISKYWLLAYLLSPIMFARRAADTRPDQFRQISQLILIAGGVVLVAGAVLVPSLLPALATKLLGTPPPKAIITLLAIAVAINSFSMLLTSDLQGRGEAHRVIVLQVGLLAASVPLFFGLGFVWSLIGIGIAWVVRTAVEYGLLLWTDYRSAATRSD